MSDGYVTRAGFYDERTPNPSFGHHDVVAAFAGNLKAIEFEQLNERLYSGQESA